MSFRNRPVLNRRHRPRWQDELRTQQLVVAGFAVAIAVALGIFGATEWAGYWDAHFAPVATVGEESFDRADLTARESAISAELLATYEETGAQMGGPNDQFLQQQLTAIQTQLQDLSADAAGTMIQGSVLEQQAATYGVTVAAADVDEAIAERMTLPARRSLELITFDALPDDAAADDEPTEEQMAAARDEADAAMERVDAGEDFGALAEELSDDFSASSSGALGWVQDDDTTYDAYYDATDDADVGDVVGPIETERGWGLVRLADRVDKRDNETLSRLLAENGSEEAYRAYVRDQVLLDAFRTYFGDEVVVSPAPQREVAQIVIKPVEGDPVPQERARHILIQPDPTLQDQAEATDEQWAAALAEAEEVRAAVSEPDADWFALAQEHSDDTGSGAQGGDLGWSAVDASPYVQEFANALTQLDLMEVSEPVRSAFGYHVIQLTGRRDSPTEQADALVDELQDDPDSFAEVATVQSEDYETARVGGDLGWVAHYQFDQAQEDAIFALDEVGGISDPIDLGTDGIAIYKLTATSESRDIEDERLDEIRSNGFNRWLTDDVEAAMTVWADPQYAPASTAATG
jgi:parvulin-like peptidyl-prolyl isomerase